MTTPQNQPQTIDEYIAGFPEDVQAILESIRTAIKTAEPDAQETISYQIPAFTLHGRHLIYFAAYKKHIGLYPAPVGHEDFKAAMSTYESGKGTVKFPLDQPIPFDLIARIVKFRVQENLERATKSKKKRSNS